MMKLNYLREAIVGVVAVGVALVLTRLIQPSLFQSSLYWLGAAVLEAIKPNGELWPSITTASVSVTILLTMWPIFFKRSVYLTILSALLVLIPAVTCFKLCGYEGIPLWMNTPYYVLAILILFTLRLALKGKGWAIEAGLIGIVYFLIMYLANNLSYFGAKSEQEVISVASVSVGIAGALVGGAILWLLVVSRLKKQSKLRVRGS